MNSLTVSGFGRNLASGVFIGLFCAVFIGVFAAIHRQSLAELPTTLLAGLAGGALMGAMLIARERLTRLQPFDILRTFPALWILFFAAAGMILALLVEILFFRERFLTLPTHKYLPLAAFAFSALAGLLITFHDRTTLHLRFSLDYLERLYLSVIDSLVSLVEAKDPDSRLHLERVNRLSAKLGVALGLPRARLERLRNAALLHELGKIGIEEELLTKPPPLKDDERERVTQHPLITRKILLPISRFREEAAIIAGLFRADGAQGELCVESSILAVADAFDSMKSKTVREPLLSTEQALEELEKEAGRRFAPSVLLALRELVRTGALDDGDEATREAERQQTRAGSTVREDEIFQSVTRTARQLGIMESFYRFIGVSRNTTRRIVYASLASGVLLGLFAGFTVWAISGESRHLPWYLLQGLIIAIFVAAVGSLYTARTAGAPRGSLPSLMVIPVFAASGLAGAIVTAKTILVPIQYPGGLPPVYLALFCALAAFAAGSIELTMQVFTRVSERLLASHEALQSSYLELTYALAFALEAKDSYTRGHSDRVARHAVKMGRKLSLTEEELSHLERAALFHDIGKIAISMDILHKKGKLSPEEYRVIQTHPEIGERILKPVQLLAKIAPYVRAHHEEFQGSGYPDRKKETQIPLFARIIAITDTYDAMISSRPYRDGLPADAAMSEIRRVANAQLDPELVELFITVLDEEEASGEKDS